MAAVGDQREFAHANSLTRAMLALVAHQIPVELHQHFAVQVVMSLKHPFRATVDGQYQPRVQGFVVDSNIAHACQPGDASVLIVSVDAATDIGKSLRERLKGRHYVLLEDLIEVERIQEFRNEYWAAMRDLQAQYDPLSLVLALSVGVPRAQPTDLRVAAAMHYVDTHLTCPVRLVDVAKAVALSEGRLRHVFVQETGIPLTMYVSWSRMKVALRGLVRHHLSLAQAAHLAGYADHAHFTRTFRRMFGVSPSIIREQSEFIYVFDEV